MKTLTVQLLDYSYDTKRRLVSWRILNIDDKIEQTLTWLAEDLAAQFGIKIDNFPEELIIQFSEQMKNRPWPFKIEIHSTAEVRTEKWAKDIKSQVTKGGDVGPPITEIQDAHQELDKYPYYETLSQIAEQEQEK